MVRLELKKADITLLAFPLYVLSMPGFVKEIIELLPDGIGTGKKFLGFVQSGFPETSQFQFMVDYLQLLSTKLGFDYLGTIIKGYGASVEMMPQFFNNSLYKKMYILGMKFGESYTLDKKIIRQFKRPYRFSLGQSLFYKFLRITGALDAYTMESTKRFSNRVENYVKYRPGYPEEIINFLIGNGMHLGS